MIIQDLFRYPIKSVGAEKLNNIFLKKGNTIPWDRAWGISHKNSQIYNDYNWIHPKDFARCYNFKSFSGRPIEGYHQQVKVHRQGVHYRYFFG